MNFFPNYPMIPNIPVSDNMANPNIDYMNNIPNIINEFDNRIKKLEQRITRLENDNNQDYNYNEPDNSFYMI